MKTTYKFTTADGIIETRTSERVYTHVVVGRRDYDKQRASLKAHHAANVKSDRANYQYWRTCATTPVGDTFPGEMFKVTQDSHDRGLRVIAEYPTEAEYVAARIKARADAIPPQAAGPEIVLQWSMAERAARQSVSTHSRVHTDVRVVALPSTPERP